MSRVLLSSSHALKTVVRRNAFNQIRMSSSALITELTNMPDFKKHIGQDSVSVIDFYATWCGPCKAMSPILEKFAQELPQTKFAKVDVDNASEVAQEYGVTAMPTFMIFKNGEKMDTIVGANPKGLLDKIKENLNA